MKRRAIIYCENQFGSMDGKTANGLIRDPGYYQIGAVIDSTKAGRDAGEYLDKKRNGIPICSSLEEAIRVSKVKPQYFIFGIAPSNAFLQAGEREILKKAMEAGMHIINPLQEFLTDDEEMVEYAEKHGVTIQDIRKPKPKKEWKMFTGRIFQIETPIVAFLGTDGACGKRTTAMIVEQELKRRGFRTAFIATGQTGLIQGASYGLAVDAFPMQYVIGELENEIIKANKIEKPDVILVEGQGALSHPAYGSSFSILKGSRPKAVILQHPPKRKVLGDFPFMKMPSLRSELELIEYVGHTKVISITLNHEGMTEREIERTILEYEQQFQLPTTDVLLKGPEKVADSMIEFFPSLKQKQQEMSRMVAI